MSVKKSFPVPNEYVNDLPKELEGWEEMYPEQFLFGKDREDWEKRQFWYLDKIHAPYPMPPLDHIFQEAWQISLSQHTTRVFCIPPAQGVAHRIVGGYQYICAVEPPSGDVIQEKAELFGQRAHYPVEHYQELWEEWLERMQAAGKELKEIKVPKELPKYLPAEEIFPNPYKGYTPAYELMEAFDRSVDLMFKGWQYHFNYLNLAYLYYLTFIDVVKKLFPSISDSTVSKMVSGAEVAMFRPDEELCRLARLAHNSAAVNDILRKDTSPEEKMEELKAIKAGEQWLEELEGIKEPWLHVSCGSGWYYYEGSWLNQLNIPFSYIKNYLERLDQGEKIERSLEKISEERDKLIEEYLGLISSEEDKQAFLGAYNDCRVIYKYAEDHLFWVEHWFHTIWWEKMREIGEVLVKSGALNETDEIFMFHRFEVPKLIEDVTTCWALGEGVPMLSWAEKAQKRRKILQAAASWSPSPALGQAPEEVAEPFTVMLWGITNDKVDAWLKGSSAEPGDVTEIKGFASSDGIAEGRARVLKTPDEIMDLEQDEVLVCPSTNPSWAPALSRAKAAVTDIGGLTCHAAIVCREYEVPSVTGTGISTSVIKTGDIVKVNGTEGTVEIVERVKE